ncbi:MAG: dihydropteroate synthase [Lachnospiraceae bacterium]|nr:dihydropteroate synthase [Lachnospiraceae bacterium]
MQIGKKQFDVETHTHTYVMGILNITPDSFSDGGKYNDMDHALQHVEQMIADGMDILDIGGESTRPGYQLLSNQEEIERVVPIIEEMKRHFDIPVSLDTYKGEVAEAGIAAGIDLVNDIWGLKYDAVMAQVIAKSGLPCCLMHNRKNTNYRCFMQDVAADLAETIQIAEKAGIADDKIILDPGVGFAKSYEQNLQVINNLDSLHVFGYPLLLGTSRKSVIGLTLDVPVTERVEGTIATSVLAVIKKCAFVRVHDVKENVRAIRMAEAILQECESKGAYRKNGI